MRNNIRDYLGLNLPQKINLVSIFALILIAGVYGIFNNPYLSSFIKIVYTCILSFSLYYSYNILVIIISIVANLIVIREDTNNCYSELRKLNDKLSKNDK